MKVGLFLVGLIVGGGIAAGASDAQEYHQTTAKAAGRSAPMSSLAPPSSQHGSIGGPVTKVNGISGMVRRSKH
jgi:hypothetical protein